MNSKNGILDPSQICKFKTGCDELFGKIRLMARASNGPRLIRHTYRSAKALTIVPKEKRDAICPASLRITRSFCGAEWRRK
jgi:hypothetical protein